MKIAIIPARGGSKRIPRKNIKIFSGKPIIEWSIRAAKLSCLFDHIIVSTDDNEISEIAKMAGAEVPFLRPDFLSDDYSTTTEVVTHATRWCLEKSWNLEAVCCIYPTAPFINPDDVLHGYHILISGNWEYTFSAAKFSASVFRSFTQCSEGGVEMLFPENYSARSQDFPIALHDAGQFYWGRPSAWLQGKKIFSRHSMPIIIPNYRVQDIDTIDDWYRAELMHKSLCKV